MFWRKPIFITGSPNTTWGDVALATSLFLRPWTWYNRKYVDQMQQQLLSQLTLNSQHNIVFSFDSGRSAWYWLLQQLGVGPGDEVILPGFTCLAVGNPVSWLNAMPIYVDADINTLNIDLKLLARKITNKTKVILLQHTFGEVVDVSKVKEIVGDRKIVIVEDCAHSLGGHLISGDAAIFGFGLDKVVSGVRSGATLLKLDALKNKGFNINVETLQSNYQSVLEHPRGLIWKSLLNPLIWHIVGPQYFWGFRSYTLGRLKLRILYKLGIIGNVVASDENVGDKPQWMPAKIAPALARLVDYQLTKLNATNEHRRKIAQIYATHLGTTVSKHNRVYQKYSLLVPDESKRKQIYLAARDKLHTFIGDWLPRPLYSKFSSVEVYQRLQFKPEENPVAIEIGQRVINLPTGVKVSPRRAHELIEYIKKY